MKLLFDKMHGAGNDFIIAEDLAENWPVQPEFIRAVCHRCKGIGGDGLILIRQDSPREPLRMRYFNSDGSEADMCGNGLRCAGAFVYRHGLIGGQQKFQLRAADGIHDIEIKNEAGTQVRISLHVSGEFHPVELENGETVYSGTVGVPHVIARRSDPEAIRVREEGAFLRYHPKFRPAGTNADFVVFSSPAQAEPVLIRTYERGVEDETLACGTGCASAGVVLHQFFGFGPKVCFLCRGKDRIEVEILKDGSTLTEIYLTGPAERAFAGEIEVGKTVSN